MTRPGATFEQLEVDTKARGFDEVIERSWSSGLLLQAHVHAS